MLVGFIVALIVLGCIYGYTALRPVPPIGSDFGQVKSSFTIAVPADKAFATIAAPPPASVKYQVAASDPATQRVLLLDGMTMSSYGYYYPVDFGATGAGTMVTVGIKSKYPFQFGPFVARAQQKAHDAMIATLKAKIEAA